MIVVKVSAGYVSWVRAHGYGYNRNSTMVQSVGTCTKVHKGTGRRGTIQWYKVRVHELRYG